MRVAAALVASLLMVACSEGGGRAPRPPETTGPYVVTAIDYHFHDAHPSQPVALDRGLQFSNQGENIHNVTFPGTPFSRNLRRGERFTIEPVSKLLDGPGRYRFVCKFHADRGMTGVLVIVA